MNKASGYDGIPVELNQLLILLTTLSLIKLLKSNLSSWFSFPVSLRVCVLSLSVISDLLLPPGLQPTRFLCPWDSPDKDTGLGCYSLLQGIFLTQGSNPALLYCRQTLNHLSHQEAYSVQSLSCVQPSVTPWTAAFQAPLSMGFSRQEYWSGVPLPSPFIQATHVQFLGRKLRSHSSHCSLLPLHLDWKNQICQNEYTTQCNLLIQSNHYQITNGTFHRTRKKLKICMVGMECLDSGGGNTDFFTD